MNIYFSRQIKNLYFFDDSVTLGFEIPLTKSGAGFSYVVTCMCNGMYDVEKISQELITKFKLEDDCQTVIDMILANTIEDNSIAKAFTHNLNEANLLPEVNGMWGFKYPQILHIELTNTCNFMCEQCYKSARQCGEFLDFDNVKVKIYDQFKGVIPVVHFTGGEPTIHSNFKDIVELFNDGYRLQLTTNGSRIVSLPIDIFKKFEAIDISLYGLSEEEYRINTGNANSFGLINEGFTKLKEADIDFRVTLVINNNNWHQMEDYVRYAIDVGAESIGFALPMQSGKLLTSTTDKWFLTDEIRKKIYRNFRYIRKVYNEKINILDWSRSNYSEMWKTTTKDDSLRCGAGKNTWWMSEKFTFRPCAFLPNEYMNLDYDTWFNYITNKKVINWSKARGTLELFANEHNLDIIDLCSIFRK